MLPNSGNPFSPKLPLNRPVTAGSRLPGDGTTSAPAPAADIGKMFQKLYTDISMSPGGAKIDRANLEKILGVIEQEIKNGEPANAANIKRELKRLAKVSQYAFEATLNILSTPTEGIPEAIQQIALKEKEKVTRDAS